ncbi:DoxX family protein [Pseudarthrobacter sp. NamB4]|uniref:DoxX family protein n=1 Tax=Pseudarthrobacter sp. NamB4 TaxID=2576837 RepID=UPI00197AE6E6
MRIGLVLPALLKIAAVLVPAAATGLVLLMAGAAVTHTRRREIPNSPSIWY